MLIIIPRILDMFSVYISYETTPRWFTMFEVYITNGEIIDIFQDLHFSYNLYNLNIFKMTLEHLLLPV